MTPHEENLREGWEEEFDKKYPSQKGVSGGIYITMYSTEEMKDFIRTLFHTQKQELREKVLELETMKGGDPENYINYVSLSDVLTLLDNQ